MFILFLSTLLLFVVFMILDRSTDFTGYFMRNYGITLAGIHFTTWLFFAVNKNIPFLNKVFSNKVLVYIGKISYSLYVYHWFLLILLYAKFIQLLEQYLHISSHLLASTLCFVITFVISMLSYQYFERPIVKLKRRFSYK